MASTRREAFEKAERILERRKKGLKVEEARGPIGDFLDRFLKFYKTEGGVAPRTWQDYRYDVEENIEPGIAAVALQDLKPRDVDQWLQSLRERGLGNRTLEYAQAVLRRALQFAVEWEILERNPAAARFRAAKRKRMAGSSASRIRFLDPDEARKFLDVIRGDRHEALYTLAITTGFRPEELYGLRWKEVDVEAADGQPSDVEDAAKERGEHGTVPVRASEDRKEPPHDRLP